MVRQTALDVLPREYIEEIRHQLNFVTPWIPNSSPEYSQELNNKTNEILRVYFNRVDNALRHIASLIKPQLTVLAADNAAYTLGNFDYEVLFLTGNNGEALPNTAVIVSAEPQNGDQVDIYVTDRTRAVSLFGELREVAEDIGSELAFICSLVYSQELTRWVKTREAGLPETVPPIMDFQPVANAGQDRTDVARDVAVNVTGEVSGGDPPFTYLWTVVSGTAVVLVNPTGLTVSFMPPEEGDNTELQFQVTDDDGDVATDRVLITYRSVAPPPDLMPSVTLPADMFNVERGVGTEVTATATGGDPPLSYQWSVISGVNVALTGATTATVSFTTPASGDNTTIRCRVTDADGDTASDEITLHYAVIDLVPVLTVPADRFNVARGITESITATATGGDPPLSYQWDVISGTNVTLLGRTTATVSFTTPASGNNTTIRCRVTDADGDTASDEITLHYAAVDLVPVLTVPADMEVMAGETISLTATVVGGALPLSYQWSIAEGTLVALIGQDTPTVSFIAPPEGQYVVVTIVVTDANVRSVLGEVRVSSVIEDVGVAFELRDYSFVAPGSVVSLAPTFSSMGNPPLTYLWEVIGSLGTGRNVVLSSLHGPALHYLAASSGFTRFRLTVTDADGDSATDEAYVSYAPVGRSEARFTLGPDLSDVARGTTVTIPVEGRWTAVSFYDLFALIPGSPRRFFLRGVTYSSRVVEGPDVDLIESTEPYRVSFVAPTTGSFNEIQIVVGLRYEYLFESHPEFERHNVTLVDTIRVYYAGVDTLPAFTLGEDRTGLALLSRVFIVPTFFNFGNAPLTYAWSLIAGGGRLINPTAVIAEFETSSLAGGSTVQLTVTDNDGQQATDTLNLFYG